MRVLSIGHDHNLLGRHDPHNESQYRQARYCALLQQEKLFVVMAADGPVRFRQLDGGRIRSYAAIGSRHITRTWRATLLALTLARRFRPDVIEYQDPVASGLPALAASLATGRPLVGGLFNDLIDNPVWLGRSRRRRIHNVLGKLVLALSRNVRCDSVATVERLRREAGFENVEYVPFFIPWLERFVPEEHTVTERLHSWEKQPVVLCVARLAEEKNPGLLLRAFALARRAVGRGELWMIGSGPLAAELVAEAGRLGIDQHVRWIPTVAYLALPPFFRRANIFVLPSNSETSARVLVLAQAAHLPTITTDTSGSREIVVDGETGFVVPVADATAMAERLGRLLADQRSYAETLCAAGYRDSEGRGERAIDGALRRLYQLAVAT